MDVGIVGLGRMGMGMGARLAGRGHRVVGYDVSVDKRADAGKEGIESIDSPAEFGNRLPAPRVVIIMVPAGTAVDSAISAVEPSFAAGDILIDGGNSLYTDSQARAQKLKIEGISLIDLGVSGGVWGLKEGFCLMAGGDEEAFKKVEPILVDLAPEGGYAYVGGSGAGHFSKMVHNGIEYGMLQAYGEGFEVLKASQFDYDLAKVSKLWTNGSVVRSWLLELAALAFEESPDLEEIKGWVEDSGEGRWTVMEAIQERVPVPVIALSLMMRFRSRQDDSFSAKVIAALRHKFGGHAIKSE